VPAVIAYQYIRIMAKNPHARFFETARTGPEHGRSVRTVRGESINGRAMIFAMIRIY